VLAQTFFEEELNAIEFLVLLKKVGLAQNILGLVERQGMSRIGNF
jgi:hypothetical protein